MKKGAKEAVAKKGKNDKSQEDLTPKPEESPITEES